MDGINRRTVFVVRLARRFCCPILVSICRRVPPDVFPSMCYKSTSKLYRDSLTAKARYKTPHWDCGAW